ncbi:hypothetical protein K8Z49_22595 [Actinomadura madurae]|uniref:hypothetical protein n=1 Tax=Actinomadura madurae TaxID=1993 RepID=UPI00399960ED
MVAATTFGSRSEANQPDPAVTTVGPTTAVTTTVTPTKPRPTPTTSTPRSASPKRSVGTAVPPGYVLRTVFAARLAVPSGYLSTQLDDYRYMFKAPPGQQDKQIIQIFVCSHEDSPDAPRGAAARAAYWEQRFLSDPRLHDPEIDVVDMTVNGRVAKVLTMIFGDDANHVRGKQEMYYSGSEGEWKIVIDYRLESYHDKIDQSPFRKRDQDLPGMSVVATAVALDQCESSGGKAVAAGRWAAVSLRLAYLTVANAFAVLRLLPMTEREKDTEILVLRASDRRPGAPACRKAGAVHCGGPGAAALVAFRRAAADAAAGAAGHSTARWHRDLIAGRHAARSKPKRAGRPPTVRSIRLLVLRLVREDPSSDYRRVHGELLVLGVKVAASTVWEILNDAGVDPAPERSATTWTGFLRSQAEALLACDFLETVTLTGDRMYVLAVIEHHTRRIRVLGATAHPTASWVTRGAVRNLVMDLEDAGRRARFLIRDRDGKFPALFDAVLADTGIQTVLSGVRMPRMNAVMERWV